MRLSGTGITYGNPWEGVAAAAHTRSHRQVFFPPLGPSAARGCCAPFWRNPRLGAAGATRSQGDVDGSTKVSSHLHLKRHRVTCFSRVFALH